MAQQFRRCPHKPKVDIFYQHIGSDKLVVLGVFWENRTIVADARDRPFSTQPFNKASF